MRNYKDYLISRNADIRQALVQLDKLAADAIVFVVDEQNRLEGSLTDGDVRRGLIKGLLPDQSVLDFIQKTPKCIQKFKYDITELISLRNANVKVFPVLDDEKTVINVINFRHLASYLPLDVVIMAGGKGSRLRPLTDDTPKPLLKVGDKAIIDHNVDRLRKFGVDDFWITLGYLGDKLVSHFESGENIGVSIKYVKEEEPLGTAGSMALIDDFKHDVVLLTNSDILTDLDYESFYLDFIGKDADMSVVSIPYQVDVPYAVIETSQDEVVSFAEKPTYTYYSNGGIYLMKRKVTELIPKGQPFNATDLMQTLIDGKGKLISYPLHGYWLDIGKHQDFAKAQKDVNHLRL